MKPTFFLHVPTKQRVRFFCTPGVPLSSPPPAELEAAATPGVLLDPNDSVKVGAGEEAATPAPEVARSAGEAAASAVAAEAEVEAVVAEDSPDMSMSSPEEAGAESGGEMACVATGRVGVAEGPNDSSSGLPADEVGAAGGEEK